MKRVRAWLVLAVLALLRRRRRKPSEEPPPPSPRPWRMPAQDVAETAEMEVPRDSRMEVLTAVLLLLAGTCGAAFAVVYLVYDDTQLYGLTLGLALVFLAAALVIAGKRVVPQETAVEPKEPFGDTVEAREVSALAKAGSRGISRRTLLGGAAAAAGLGLGSAFVLPAASLGPNANRILADSPWRRGRALVDEDGAPVGPDDLDVGGFLTAFPAGASLEDIGSPVIVCRLRPQELQLPADRSDWAVEGVVAYSKSCTHAGCAVATFRYPLYEPREPPPALVCPCHYSTFDPRNGAEVTFGPASRPLPQLPLALDGSRHFVAAGPLSGPPGPSYDRVRLQHDT
jgi:ubiquinol-cytochrome c reductase iron-sulfur subunit